MRGSIAPRFLWFGKNFINGLKELIGTEGLLNKMLQAGFSKLTQRQRIKVPAYENHFYNRIEKSEFPEKIHTA